MDRVRIERRFQGVDGIAQGGYLAAILAGTEAHRREATFRSPTPVDTDLDVETDGDVRRLTLEHRLLAETAPWTPSAAPPPPVPLDVAAAARTRGEAAPWSLATHCFSCGLVPTSFRIHPGPVEGATLFATPYRPPAWTAGIDGLVAAPFLWAPLDCTAGWRTIDAAPVDEPGVRRRPAMTGRLGVEIVGAPEPETDLVVVADADPEWDGRRRGARSAIYTADGRLVARSESLWVALP